MGKPLLTVQTQTLRRAADILGGKDPLRAILKVPMRSLEDWIDGQSNPPMDVFLKAVDIITVPAGNHTPAASSVRARVVTPFLEAVFRKDERHVMLEAALDAALAAANASMGNVQLKTPEGLRIVAQRGFRAPFLDFFACVTHNVGSCGTALKYGARIVVTDVAADPIFAGTDAAQVMEDAGVRAVQSTPLLSASGEVLGVLSTHYDEPCITLEADLEALDGVVQRAAFWLDQPTA